ncbi:neuronal acetylcholine receptor subunit alpha-10 [Exaiptasia diaphana]|uniref:Uncharacterized protein n=1 Tax=Exaiptasia diaphana TaxID=2652724 RepID=A0A913Y4W3_EXADI|nr:neuronal acetylcholine receptor subunit alpha-10 [Exaiptasia diaphana]
MKIFLLAFFLVVLVRLGCSRREYREEFLDDDEARLHRDLFGNYTPEVRPVKKKTQVVTVKLGITIHQIIDLVEKTQLLQTSVWIRQSWRNPLLTWDPKNYGGIDKINIKAERVWVPDIYLYNNGENVNDGGMNHFSTQITLHFNGMNIWLAPILLTSSCKIDVTHFPFDEQRCILKFGSWTYDGLRLDLVSESDSGDVSKYVTNGEWDLVSFPAKRNEIVYVCCPEPYPDVTYTLHIRRKALYYYVNLIVPCILITCLTLLSFILPPDSGERITLVITNLLAMTVFMLLVAEVLPATSEVIPIISIYYSVTLFEVGLALVATCMVLKIYFTNPVTTEMPNWVRIIILNWMAKFVRIKVPSAIQEIKNVFKEEGREVNEEIRREHETISRIHEGSEVSGSGSKQPKMTERKSFISSESPVFQQLEIADFHRLLAQERRPSLWSTQSPDRTNRTRPSSVIPDIDINALLGNERSAILPMMICRQENIAKNLRRLVKLARSKEEEDIKREEWKVVAEVIDKFFLWVFLTTIVTSVLLIFLQTR